MPETAEPFYDWMRRHASAMGWDADDEATKTLPIWAAIAETNGLDDTEVEVTTLDHQGEGSRAESSSIIRTTPSRKASAERQSSDIQVPPPSLETRPFDCPYWRTEPKGTGQQWESPGTFLGLPAVSTGTSVKQLKDHSRRSASALPSSRQVTALAGLFRDI